MSDALLANRRILVIDDNTAIHDDFRKILASAQQSSALDEDEAFLFEEPEPAWRQHADTYEVDCASQGRQGLELVRAAAESNRPYAVAFVDMRMPPGWDGVETIQHLWEADAELLVVVCTAYSDYSWQEMIDQLGQSERLLILKKPFDVVEVEQIAAALTRKWDARREVREAITEMAGKIEIRTREAEEARTETNQILGAIPLLLIEVDADNVVTRWNQRASDVLGPTAAQAQGRRIDDLQIHWIEGSFEDLLRSAAADSGKTGSQMVVTDPQGNPQQLTFSLCSPGNQGKVLLVGSEVHDTGFATTGGPQETTVTSRLKAPLQSVGQQLERLRSSCANVLPTLKACQELLGSEPDPGQLAARLREIRIDRLDEFIEEIPVAIEESGEGVDLIRSLLQSCHCHVDSTESADVPV